jgi:hypothetical protein
MHIFIHFHLNSTKKKREKNKKTQKKTKEKTRSDYNCINPHTTLHRFRQAYLPNVMWHFSFNKY